jgi:preprotein translocase subunit SecD
MKKILFSLLFVCGLLVACSKRPPVKQIPDGLYLVSRIDSQDVAISSLASEETVVRYNPLFDEFNEDVNSRIIINTNEYVPLELQAITAEQQTVNKKKLLLTLTRQASDQLKTFTEKHLMKMVAIVVDGEVLTRHKVKAVLTGGQLQISRCKDNACERVFVKLKDNVMESDDPAAQD